MKIGFYSPYWSTLGGGEKYMLDIASCFPEDEIFLFGAAKDFPEKARARFNFTHSNLKIHPDTKLLNGKLMKQKFKYLDLFFYQCNGSIFLPTSKKNFLLVQSPIHSPDRSLKNKIKLLFWNKIICNSEFTAKFVRQKTWAIPTILCPCIEKIPALKKENVILSVGRFFRHMHSKKQEVLIEVYKKLYDSTLCHSGKNWNLILAGSVSESDIKYLDDLKEMAQGYPIEFHVNIPLVDLHKLYGKAKIYWHAAGFGEDLEIHPEKAEHFGISTLEAISAECYPLVFKAGGQKEIIGDNEEFYWETKEKLEEKTRDLITNDKSLTFNLNKLLNIPDKFSFKNFKSKLYEIVR